MKEPKYIVTGKQIISNVRCALEDHITNGTIIRELMVSIKNNIWSLLEDDCEEYHEDDLK